MNLEIISSLLVTYWVWFAINTLKVRAYLIIWLIICTLLCPSLHEVFPWYLFIDYTKAFYCVNHNNLWKILQEMGTPDHLICPLRNLYAGQEATVYNQTWNNRMVPNRQRSTSRLCIVTLLI